MKQKLKKNKTNSSGNVIRTILREELKNFATKDDLIKFEKGVDKEFVSFEAKMDFKFENLERRIDFKLGGLETRTDEKARQYRDDVLTSNDKLAKKFETVQQELEIGNLQMKRQLEDHQQRITILESAQ